MKRKQLNSERFKIRVYVLKNVHKKFNTFNTLPYFMAVAFFSNVIQLKLLFFLRNGLCQFFSNDSFFINEKKFYYGTNNELIIKHIFFKKNKVSCTL